MKKYILTSFAWAALLTACNDNYNDQFDISHEYNDVKNGVAYTLTDADYAMIAGLEKNKQIALAKDPEGETALKALEAVGKNKYFTTEAPVEVYVPAFLTSKFPQATQGSKFKLTYNVYQEPSAYLADINSVQLYEFSSADYKAVWGESMKASFLSPKTLAKIPAVLNDNIDSPEEGDVKVVQYNYSQTEPGISGGVEQMVYQKVETLDAEGGKYVIAGGTKEGTYVTFGVLKDESKDYGYMYGDNIALEGNSIDCDIDKFLMTLAPTDNGFSIQRPDGNFVYQSAGQKNFNKGAMPAEGGDWSFTPKGDGTFTVKNVSTQTTVKLNYYVDGGSYSFGSYPGSYFGTFLDESLLNGNDGGFTVQNVILPDEEFTSAPWTLQKSYGWKATTGTAAANYASDSWLVTPMIDLTYAKAPVMKLEHALNFLKGNERADYIDLKISEDYAGDVKTATWTSVAIPAWPEGTGWSFVTSGDIDLSAYAGKKVTLAWHYIGTTECAPTYEVKNVSVKGTCDDYYADVCLFKEIPQSEAVMTRASGNAVSHGLYRYNGTAWELFESDEAEFTTVSVDYYSVLGTDKIEKPKDVLPPYLAVNYPYAQKGDRVGLAYIDKNKDYVIEEYSFLNGVWTATPEAQAKTSPFNFDEGGYVLGKSTYYEATLTDGDDGGFKPQDVLLTEGLTFVWKSDNSYGRKGQAYISSKGALESDSWLISPEIDLTEAETPILIFEEAVNKISASVTEQMKICVSTGYENDATACDWDELEFEERPAGNSWDFMSNQTDLTAYKGQKIRLAFHYTSTKASAGTWEVKNISIAEPAQ